MFDEIKQTIINMYLSTTILSILSTTKIQKKYSHTKFKIIPKSEKIFFYLTIIKSAKKKVETMQSSSFAILGIHDLTRSLQSTTFQNPGWQPERGIQTQQESTSPFSQRIYSSHDSDMVSLKLFIVFLICVRPKAVIIAQFYLIFFNGFI